MIQEIRSDLNALRQLDEEFNVSGIIGKGLKYLGAVGVMTLFVHELRDIKNYIKNDDYKNAAYSIASIMTFALGWWGIPLSVAVSYLQNNPEILDGIVEQIETYMGDVPTYSDMEKQQISALIDIIKKNPTQDTETAILLKKAEYILSH